MLPRDDFHPEPAQAGEFGVIVGEVNLEREMVE